MKKALPILTAVFLLTTAANAQITKGKILVGGTVAYSQFNGENTTSNFSPSKQRYVTISPSVGTVVRENLVVGVEASYANTRETNRNGTTKIENEYKSYGGGVFMRRYVPLVKNFYFFGQGGVGASASNSSHAINSITDAKGNGWSATASLVPGLSYGITKKFLVEAALNSLAVISYSSSTNKKIETGVETERSKSNAFNFSTSLGSNAGFSIGFRFLL